MRAAAALMLARAAVGLVSAVSTVVYRNALRSLLLRQDATLTQDRLNTVLNVTVVITAGLNIVLAGLFALLALKVRQGRNWARVVTFIFAGLGAIGVLYIFVPTATAASRVLTVIVAIIDIFVLVLLARKPSNDFFTPAPALHPLVPGSPPLAYPPSAYPAPSYPPPAYPPSAYPAPTYPPPAYQPPTYPPPAYEPPTYPPPAYQPLAYQAPVTQPPVDTYAPPTEPPADQIPTLPAAPPQPVRPPATSRPARPPRPS